MMDMQPTLAVIYRVKKHSTMMDTDPTLALIYQVKQAFDHYDGYGPYINESFIEILGLPMISVLYLMEDNRRQYNVEKHVGVEVELLPHSIVHHQPNSQPCTHTHKNTTPTSEYPL